ncbi:MAG: Na+:solute symporter [Aureispira sp.]|nr:Na+:solute symporter [Aureispira sp.]
MQLSTLDWFIIIGFLLVIFGVGLSFTKKSGKDMESFFLGGRNMHWLLAGVSMVATTFAADTPLAVTELVGQNGIAGNWLWWSFLAGGMLTTFFFARMWQRSGVMTEVELIELRYSGEPAKFLRGFKAIYLGVVMNVIVIAWVNVALQSLLTVFFGLDPMTALMYTGLAMLMAAIYTSFSGIQGVAVTDAIQFVVAMVGCAILAYLVITSPEIGGIDNLKEQAEAIKPGILNFFPTIDNDNSIASTGNSLVLSFGAFFAYAGVQWWASWYPGAEPGGGGYIAQRMMSTRSDKDAVYATLFFQIAHYCIRPWAWILVALAAVVLYPELSANDGADAKLGYVYAMRDFLPSGLQGLLLVAFLAAYMSTISTQLNWGASYVVNDLYKRFISPNESDKHYVFSSRIFTLVLMVIGLIVSTKVNSISGAWGFIMQCGAGLGLVLILRWYWARINAWSEIAATIAPFFSTTILYFTDIAFPEAFLITVLFTTVVWLAVTFLTPPTDAKTLQNFWQKVHQQDAPNVGNMDNTILDSHISTAPKPYGIADLLLCWLSGIVLTYSMLFLTGKLLLKEWNTAGICAVLALVSAFGLQFFMKKVNLID